MCLDGTETAKVRPIKVSFNDIDVIRLLHHGIVDGDFLAGREQFPDRLSLIGSPEGRGDPVHDPCDLRRMGAKLRHDGRDTPDEYAGVPEIGAGGKIFLGGCEVRLLLELTHLDNLLGTILFCEYVAVAGLRTSRLDPYRHYAVPFRSEIQRLAYNIGESLLIHDKRVRRCHHNIGLRADRRDLPTGVGDAGSRVTRLRLGKDVALRDQRQLLPHDSDVVLRGDNPEVRWIAHRREPVEGQLYHRLTYSKQIHELLRPFRCADRPQAAADPSGHNHNMCFHKIKRFKVRSDGNLHQNKMIVSVNLEKIGDIP